MIYNQVLKGIGYIFLLGLFACNGQTKQEVDSISSDEMKEEVESASIYSLLISKEGNLIREDYFNGKTRDSLCDVQSLTKGLMSILVGVAIDQGFIESVDTPIEQFLFEEFEGLGDSKKKAITIRHLLNQTSGLAWKGHLEHEDWLQSPDPIGFVLEKDLVQNPGSFYNYNSGATHLLSVILSRASNRSTLEFAEQYLFSPLDINEVEWQKRNQGYYDGSGLGLRMRPIDLMKMGQLLEAKGSWKGKTIVSASWVEKLLAEEEKLATTWGLPQSAHGFCWYKSEFMGKVVDYGMGYGGQFILMIPSVQLILVTTHREDTPRGIEQQIQFLSKDFPKLLAQFSGGNEGKMGISTK